MELVFDTETTGITRLSFANKLNYKKWPRLVQVAWILVKDGAIQFQGDSIIRPVDFLIPPKTTQIHGITQERAESNGADIRHALTEISYMMERAEAIVAHNLAFDLGVLESEAIRLNRKLKIPQKRICTQYLGRIYMHKEKRRKLGGYPSLSQLYESLFGFTFNPKHNAVTDTVACFHVFKRLKQLGYVR